MRAPSIRFAAMTALAASPASAAFSSPTAIFSVGKITPSSLFSMQADGSDQWMLANGSDFNTNASPRRGPRIVAPTMITDEMHQDLARIGYHENEIRMMDPLVARRIIEGANRAGMMREEPPEHYVDPSSHFNTNRRSHEEEMEEWKRQQNEQDAFIEGRPSEPQHSIERYERAPRETKQTRKQEFTTDSFLDDTRGSNRMEYGFGEASAEKQAPSQRYVRYQKPRSEAAPSNDKYKPFGTSRYEAPSKTYERYHKQRSEGPSKTYERYHKEPSGSQGGPTKTYERYRKPRREQHQQMRSQYQDFQVDEFLDNSRGSNRMEYQYDEALKASANNGQHKQYERYQKPRLQEAPPTLGPQYELYRPLALPPASLPPSTGQYGQPEPRAQQEPQQLHRYERFVPRARQQQQPPQQQPPQQRYERFEPQAYARRQQQQQQNPQQLQNRRFEEQRYASAPPPQQQHQQPQLPNQRLEEQRHPSAQQQPQQPNQRFEDPRYAAAPPQQEPQHPQQSNQRFEEPRHPSAPPQQPNQRFEEARRASAPPPQQQHQQPPQPNQRYEEPRHAPPPNPMDQEQQFFRRFEEPQHPAPNGNRRPQPQHPGPARSIFEKNFQAPPQNGAAPPPQQWAGEPQQGLTPQEQQQQDEYDRYQQKQRQYNEKREKQANAAQQWRMQEQFADSSTRGSSFFTPGQYGGN